MKNFIHKVFLTSSDISKYTKIFSLKIRKRAMIITFYLAFEVRIKKIHVWSLYSLYTLQMLAFLSFFLFHDFFFNSNHNSRMKLFFSFFNFFCIMIGITLCKNKNYKFNRKFNTLIKMTQKCTNILTGKSLSICL